MARVKITETVLRDGHQSIAATRMRLRQMLPVLEAIDELGYNALECWGGATFDTCMRFLDEDPWERLRTIKQHVKKTPLQMLLRGQNILGYRHYADDVVYEFVNRAVDNGIDIIRVFDALNDPRNMEAAIKAAKDTKSVHVLGLWSTPSARFTPWNPSPKSVRNCRIWASIPSVSRICRVSCRLMTPITSSAC